VSFFFNTTKQQAASKPKRTQHIPIDTMRSMGCSACAINTATGLQSPKMQPYGDEYPDVYILGEMPSEDDDARGKPFSGKDSRTLDLAIPRSLSVRYNHTIRCHATGKAVPAMAETECCRNSIIADIEQSKPKVIVGTGPAPLAWATGLTNISNWRGKPCAVKIGKHTCWYYPVYALDFVRSRAGSYGKSEIELVFEWDWKQIAELVDSAIIPVVYTGNYDEGIVTISGNAGRADLRRLEDALNFMVKLPQAGLDIETIGLRPYPTDAKIITCAVGNFNDTVAFALDHPEGWPEHMRKDVWGLFIDYLLQSNKKICHNVGFELEWLCYKIDKQLAYCTEWADTMCMAHTLDERKGINSLDDLTKQHFGFFLKQQSDVDVKRILEFPLEGSAPRLSVLRYNGMDTKWTDKLHDTLLVPITANKKFEKEYKRKLRLAPALVCTQLQGVSVDQVYAKQMQVELETNVLRLEKAIKATAEVKQYEQRFGVFSPTAPADVLKLMKVICKREEIEKAGGGETSDEGALSKIPASEVPSAPLILEHRATSKLSSTYVLPVTTGKLVMPDGKIHTQYNSMIAETNRLSSEDPNLQNYPKRKHKKIRGMITANGDWFFPADYGQLEARVFAWATEDEALMRSMWLGTDIHGRWTDHVLREWSPVKDRLIIDYKIDKRADDADAKIRKNLRDEIKNGWVFPQFFGASTRSCAANLKIPEEVTEEMGNEFWGEFTGVKKWQERILRAYEKNLYVETLSGSRRRGALSKNQILNHPIQGSAAHFVEEAMCELTEIAVMEDDNDMQPRLNVHDDLTAQIPDYEDQDLMWAKVDRIMRVMCKHRFPWINVPVVVELQCGRDWYHTEKLQDYRSDVLFNLVNPYA
jgi:uracil-DNA glycosylase family 4